MDGAPPADATERRISELESRVERLEQELAGRTPAPAAAPRAVLPPVATVAPVPASAPRPAPVAKPRRDIETMLGANWLARAGVIVLALGVVFFLKLAFDNDWIGLRGRIFIGVLGGIGLFATGETLRTRRIDPVFTQSLAAGGAVITYASIYLAYALPDYRAAFGLTLTGELILLALVSVLVAGYAMWRDLPKLAGVAEALAVILLAPAAEFSEAGLAYALILSLGILGAAMYRARSAAHPGEWSGVALTATLGGFVALFASLPADLNPWLILIGGVVHAAASIYASARTEGGQKTFVAGGAPLALAFVASFAADKIGVIEPVAWVTFLTGVGAAAAAFLLPVVAMPLALAAGALLLVAPLAPWPWPGPEAALSHIGLAAFALGLRFVVPRARTGLESGAAAALGLALLGLAVSQRADIGEHALAWGLVSAIMLALAAGAWFMRREGDLPQPLIRQAYLGIAALTPVAYLGLLLDGWSVAITWALLAFATLGFGFALNDREARMASFGLFGLVLLRIFIYDLPGLSTGYRVLTFLLTGVVLLAASFLYARARNREKQAGP